MENSRDKFDFKGLPPFSGRVLVIGDVHGCYRELGALLREVQADPKTDRIVFIGDLINKGPSSRGVWELFRAYNAISIVGNHELSMLHMLDGAAHKHVKYLDDLHRDFGNDLETFTEDVRRWPLWLTSPGLMLVHAGLVPGQHPSESPPWTLVTIRTWDGKGKDLFNPRHPPWFEFYEGDDLVVFGHWAALGGLNRRKVIGLDTGCVYGGMLSCLVLPERRFVRVSAQRPYCLVKR